MHSENTYIKQLSPLVDRSLEMGLLALRSGDQTYIASAKEQYAQNVFSRVHEIDNAIKSMKIALEYLSKSSFYRTEYNFSDHHAFHVENFLLRLTSVVDRSFLLAGTTMLMENSEIERLGGNRKISKNLKEFSTEAISVLEKMENAVEGLRESRNKIAHQSGFSN